MSLASDGGVRSPAPPGKESEAGEVKALACIAVEGWEFRDSLRVSMIMVAMRRWRWGWGEWRIEVGNLLQGG
jgi:hypothetical protein